MNFKKYTDYYHNTLLKDVLQFWMNHSIDAEYGGYFTSLDRKGNVFDADKFIWLQCRQVWTFAKFYNVLEKNPQWLETAEGGAIFLQQHGRDEKGNWYFALNREGIPLIQPYNIFSDCFAAMAFSQLFNATGEDDYRIIAKETFRNIMNRLDNPKGRYSKDFPGTRPLQSFALPMILSNLVLEMESVLDEEVVETTIDKAIHIVMEVFYLVDFGTILENVTLDGKFSDTYEGRLLNPGHVLEAMWFVMELGVRRNDSDLIQKAVQISISTLNRGWDENHEGIFYFLDVKGHPPQQLEWDQKLWWVHLEALVATLKGYYLTGNVEMLSWFERLNTYTLDHFPDPEYGEWYGYLNRQGEILLPLKGGKWKGCFHVPRGLYQIYNMLEKISLNEK